MTDVFDTVLLLALPASGKSEVRRYMASLTPEQCRNDFHMGPTVQLDDFPYVHLMRRIDDELVALGRERVFFGSADKPFCNPYDWGTLIHLINEDFQTLVSREASSPPKISRYFFDRIDRAGAKAGIPARLAGLPAGLKTELEDKLRADCEPLLADLHKTARQGIQGKTVVIEFARGGAQGSSLPLAEPFGYRYSLSCLAPAILDKAVVLYVWVTPEESRRKNQARANPDDPGSILHHGVPLEVMLKDYGCDDMDWLEENSEQPGRVPVKAHGQTYHLPVGRFDNRVDKTTFVREDPKSWKKQDVDPLHQGLSNALGSLGSQLRVRPRS